MTKIIIKIEVLLGETFDVALTLAPETMEKVKMKLKNELEDDPDDDVTVTSIEIEGYEVIPTVPEED